MSKALLEIDSLSVMVESKMVVDGLKLQIAKGEVVILTGDNGSGKSSLTMTLMGDSRFAPQSGSQVSFEGNDLLKMSPDERSSRGLFVAWQNPIAIPGVSVFSLCKTIYEVQGNKINELVAFKNLLEQMAEKVGLPKGYIGRNVNEGFSGGERKRLELLQMLLLKPKLAILDEIDSGLDGQGVEILAKIIGETKREGTSFLLITHNKKLLKDVVVDKTWEMKDGRLSTGV
jgi:Fe-S cluster assembly ATP-binding protein